SRLAVIDGTRASPTFNTILTTLSLGRENFNTRLMVDEAANRVITLSPIDYQISVINATTSAIVGTIQLKQAPLNLALNTQLHRAYASSLVGFVTAVDLATGTAQATIPTGAEMTFPALDPANHGVWVPFTATGTGVRRINETGVIGSLQTLPHTDGRVPAAVSN